MKPRIDYIVFEVTSACNLRCRYCYNTWKRPGADAVGPSHTYARAKRTLARLFSVAEVTGITFTGGEPFLAPRLPELALYCRLRKKSVTVITNGNAGTPEGYRQMLSIGVSLFELPLHSPTAQAHDFMTGIPGSWEKSLASIKLLQSLHAIVVPVIVITKANCQTVGNTIRFLRDLGCLRVMLNRFNVGGAGVIERESMQPSLQELRRAFVDARAVGQELRVALSSNVCTPVCALDPVDYPGIAFTACNPDDFSRRPLTLTIDGDLRFCNHSPVVMGNIFRQEIEEITHSEYVRQWSSVIPDRCSSCGKYRRCFGGCRAASEQLGLTLREVDPVVEEYGLVADVAQLHS